MLTRYASGLGMLLSFASPSINYGQAPTSPPKATATQPGTAIPQTAPKRSMYVYFSPNCTEAVVQAIEDAKKSVRIQACSLRSTRIAKAIIDAKKRGLEVLVILDKGNRSDKYSSAAFLKSSDHSYPCTRNNSYARRFA